MRPGRRMLLAATAIVVAAAVVTVLATGGDHDDHPQPAAAMSGRDRLRLQGRIERDTTFLVHQGIYLQETGQAASCVSVGLVNPTAPNVAYMRRRYPGPLCFERVGGPMAACVGWMLQPGHVRRTVPDVRGLDLYDAERRVLAAGFPFSILCAGERYRKAVRPSPLEPDALARVTGQCPAPGTRMLASLPSACGPWRPCPAASPTPSAPTRPGRCTARVCPGSCPVRPRCVV